MGIFSTLYAQDTKESITHRGKSSGDTLPNRKKGVPISSMSNTIVVQQVSDTNVHNTIPDKSQIPKKDNYGGKTTTTTNTVTSTGPATLEDLTARVNELESEVRVLQSRVLFSSFIVIKYQVTDEDLTPSGNPVIPYKQNIRINHPFLNNHPKFLLMVQTETNANQNEVLMQSRYNDKDGYWYIEAPIYVFDHAEQLVAKESHNGYGQEEINLNHYDSFNDFLYNGGLAWGNFFKPRPGQVFTILAFEPLPDQTLLNIEKQKGN